MGRLAAAVLTVGAMLVAAYGCRDATQVTIDVSASTVSCGALQGVQITVAGDPGETERRANTNFVTATVTCAEPASHEIGTLVVTPGASGKGAIVVVAGIRNSASTCKESNKYDGCVVARRSFAFRDHVSSTIPIVLDPACVDVPCDVATTCKKGTCITSAVDCADDGSCVSKDPRGRDDEDSGAPVDGSTLDQSADGAPPDGASDAPVDGASDGGEEPIPAFTNCRSSCVGAGPITGCPPSLTCCFLAGGPGGGPAPATTCLTPPACFAPAAGTRAGIAGCCQSPGDCGPGNTCCLTPKTADGLNEPHGYAVCRPASECVAPRMLSCTTSVDCVLPATCKPYPAVTGYGQNFMTCQ